MDHRLYWILEQNSAFSVGDVGAAFEKKRKQTSKVGGGMQSPRRGPQGETRWAWGLSRR